jgi:hypothetical protein
MPPPSPHSSIGRVVAVTVTCPPSPWASITCTETVFGDDGTAAWAAASICSGEAPTSARTRSRTAGASDSRKVHSSQPKLSPNVRTSECSV